MAKNELLNGLKRDEDAFLERKSTPHQFEVVKSLVAFANSLPPGREAVLIIGQGPDKRIIGVDDIDKAQRKIVDWANRRCYPSITVRCETLAADGREVIAVVVPSSNRKPHFAGPAFIRVGSKTEEATDEILEELIASRNSKAAVILAHKGEIVTADFEERWAAQWNSPERVILKSEDFVIEHCSAHSVELRGAGSGRVVSISLDRVIITKDVVNHRPLRLRIKPE